MGEEDHGFMTGQVAGLLTDECLADKLGLWLRLAQKTFADLVNSDFQRFRVTQLDFLVLTLIASYPGCRQTMISQRLDIKSPNLAAAIDYLVQRGFVSKISDMIDRRANHLTLTDSGTLLVEQLGRRYVEITRSFFPRPQGEYNQRAMVSMLKLIAQRPYMAAVVDHGAIEPGDLDRETRPET